MARGDKLQEEIEELFADLWQVPRFTGLRRGFRPNVDSFHTDDPHELTVIAELPSCLPMSMTRRWCSIACRRTAALGLLKEPSL